MEIFYSRRAEHDLEEIYRRIDSDSHDRAVRYMQELGDYILNLGEFPELGAFCRYEELASLGIRVLIKDNYIIFYKIKAEKNQIMIVRVLHGATNYRNLIK